MSKPIQFPTEFHSEALGPVVLRDTDGTLSVSPLQEFRLAGGTAFAITSSKRTELLEAMAAGEVVELEIDFRAFSQIEGESNANHLRFKNGILRKLARSFRGVPFLRDHEQGNLLARGGTITSSHAVKVDDGLAFDMTAVVTAPFAVDALLRGNLDRFSIGWAHGGIATIMCSLCNTPIFSKCWHSPGDIVEDEDSGEQSVVEFVFTEAVGVETSGVSVPAVAGTGITEVRSALSSYAAQAASREDPDMSEIAKALGLPADATEETILAALAARNEARTAASATHAEQAARVVELEAQNVTLAATSQAVAVDLLFTEFSDRLPVTRDAEDPTKRIPSALEVQLRKLALTSIGSARAILEAQPKAIPVGPVVADAANPAHSAGADVPADVPWSSELETQLKALGMTKADYLKFGPHAEQASLIPPMALTYAGSKIH